MKDIYNRYFSSDEAFNKLWDECIFVLDTNILLDLFRRSENTRVEIITLLNNLGNRLWIPHQVSFEFINNYQTVIDTEKNYISRIEEILNDHKKQFVRSIRENSRDRTIEIRNIIIQKQVEAYDSIKDALDEYNQKLEENYVPEKILDDILNLFVGKIGPPFQSNDLMQIYIEGELRYSLLIPPGYSDAVGKNKKIGMEKFGDLVIWKQIINKSKVENKPIIFITNDKKEDWYLKQKGKTLGPRLELIKEFSAETNSQFHMYQLDRFLKYANQYLEADVEEDVIDEIKNSRTSLLHNLEETIFSIQDYQNRISSLPIYSLSNDIYEIFQVQQKDFDASMSAIGRGAATTYEYIFRIAQEQQKALDEIAMRASYIDPKILKTFPQYQSEDIEETENYETKKEPLENDQLIEEDPQKENDDTDLVSD